MQVNTVTKAHPAVDRAVPPRRLDLTAFELLQLGLFRIGYVTDGRNTDGGPGIVIHGANGMAIARADNVEHAVDLAVQLDLTLVPVH